MVPLARVVAAPRLVPGCTSSGGRTTSGRGARVVHRARLGIFARVVAAARVVVMPRVVAELALVSDRVHELGPLHGLISDCHEKRSVHE